MDKNYGCLTDDDFFARLKQYGLPHGPIVGTTRKLYEKKLYEYERRLGQQQPLSGSPTICTTSTRKLYEKKIQEYENKLKQQGFGVGAPTARLCQRNSSVKDIYPMSTHISTYTYSSPIETITSEAYRNSGTTENHSSQQTGPIQVKTRRSKSLIPKSTDGSQNPLRGLMEMTDLLIEEAEMQASSRKLSAPAVRSHYPQWARHLASDSPPPHQQKHPEHQTLDLGKRMAQTAVQGFHSGKPCLSETLQPGRSMEEYKGLTDNELIARLKKYNISHGPLVGTTRKLYEKKVYEYEKERKPLSSYRESGSYTEPSSTSESYVRETFVSPRSRETLSYGREALGSGRVYVRENYDSPRTEEYYSYRNEGRCLYGESLTEGRWVVLDKGP
uniref:LEM domain-containing protein n=1 Tax=Anolis carolinensis TaxID=28377 RepID=A0A803SM77_ANOCA